MTEQSVLETLRRVPDRIILATMGRELDLGQGDTCLCGWCVREKLAEIRNVGASTVDPYADWNAGNPRKQSQNLFGGTMQEWQNIYWGVMDARMPIIERAFVRRVNEAVYPRKRRPSKETTR